MKKKYIRPTVLIVNIEKDALLAGSLTSDDIPSAQSTSDEENPAEWAD